MKSIKIVAATLLWLVLFAPAYGQRVRVDADKTRGIFQVATSAEPFNVRYTLGPAYPDNLLLQFVPKGEFVLNAHIINSQGVEMLNIKPETVTMRYANSLDVSRLAPGNYFVEVYNGPGKEKNYRIPFTIGTK